MSKERIIISYQGAAGAFSHQASELFAAELFPSQEYEYLPCRDFASVFANSEGSSFGVVPLENSSIGSITAVYDLLRTMKSSILAEIYLPVHHQLIALQRVSLKEITEVHSHPAALEQCKIFFLKNKHLKAVSAYDTAGAALSVKDSGNERIAVIASRQAAQEYGLIILQEDIEDYAGNSTRFALVGREIPGFSQTYPCKLSLCFACTGEAQKPGQILSQFEATGAVIQKIEARPLPATPWHFTLYADLAIASENTLFECQKLMKERSPLLKILGIYRSLKEKNK